MMSADRTAVYRPFDQHKHLGDPPWEGDDLIAWEFNHGHDARIKCYAEFGCQVVEAQARDEGRAEVVAAVEALPVLWSSIHGNVVDYDQLRDALRPFWGGIR